MHYLKYLTGLINIRTMILITLIFILFNYVMKQYSRNPRWVKFSKELPGPRAYPIIGTTIALLIGVKDGFGQFFINCMNIYGSTFRIWNGDNLAVVLSDVNDVQTVMTSSMFLEKKQTSLSFNMLFGNSIGIATPVAVWKYKRREYQQFFIKNNFIDRGQEINELINKYIEKMKKEVHGPEFDLEDYMNNLSLDTILKTHLNYELSDQERKELNLCHRLNEANVRLSLNTFFPFSILKVLIQWLQPVDIVGTKKIVHNFVDKVVNLIQNSSNSAGEQEVAETKILTKETFAASYISKLIKLEKEINETDLVHSEVLSIIVGGTETTGVTMAFCFLALAAHPEIQEKVYQEIYQVFGDDERPAEVSDLNKFLYLEQVIKETQRLFTLIPIIVRSVLTDIKIGPHIYPAGTTLILNFGGIHHNTKIYPDPYCFNPDNFTAEAIKKRPGYSFLPFGAGPRNCIGKEFAEMNMKLTLIAFLRVFTFHTSVKLENIKLRAGSFEKSSSGYPVSIKLRRNISQE